MSAKSTIDRRVSWGLALGFVMVCLGSAAADIPPRPNPGAPPPPPPRMVTANVKVQQRGPDNVYRIVIPQSLLKSPDLQLGEFDGSQIEAPFEIEEAAPQRRTLFAGLALSAAACSLVLVRKRSYGTKVVLALVFAGVAYAGAEWAYADLAPFRPRGPVKKAAKIQIEVIEKGSEVQLFLPANRRAPVQRPQGGFGSGFGSEGASEDGAPPPETRATPAAPK